MVAFKPVPNVQTSIVLFDRYPGVLPFNDTPLDHSRFFGRDEETRLLMHQLLRVDLLVFFAMPGLGKTSLLNAKLFPLLRARDFLPLPVRFNDTEHALTPLKVFTAAIERTCQTETIDYTPGDKESLWEFFKTAVFWRGDRLQTPVLILDQFEELFTLQGEEFRHMTAAELGQLRGRQLPHRVRQQLQEGQHLPFSDKPPEVKVLLSVREDALGLLQEITPEIPTILQNRFRLTGLSVEDASQAIIGPAGLVAEDVQFATRPFTYNETTVNKLIETTRIKKEGSIDPFLLQILCNHIEKQVRQKQVAGNATETKLIVDSSYLSDEQGIKTLMANFYLDALKQLTPPKLRRRARRLCEVGLLTGNGRRHSLVVEEIQKAYKLDSKALTSLERARLLRKEARRSSFSYEISHDRLAEAIQEKRRWRLPREVKIGVATFVLFVLVVLVAAALFTYFQAESRKHIAEARDKVEKILDYIIFDLRDELTDHGGRPLLDDIQKQVDAYYERMSGVGESDEILRRKAVSYNNRGDLFLERDLDLAGASYQIALAIHKQLAARDPANIERQRDLSISYERIGDVQDAQENRQAALSAYEDSLKLRQELAARDPANLEWQHDLSVSYNKIGDVQYTQRALAAALSAYQQSLQIAEKLAAHDPANLKWQTDLAVSLYKNGTVFEQQDPPRKKEAATNYQRMLNILRPLAAANRLAADQKGLIADVEKRLEGLKD